jgi:hypothetical protein
MKMRIRSRIRKSSVFLNMFLWEWSRRNLAWPGGLIIFFLLFQGCAKIGSPTGGIRDTQPPKYVKGIPENRSTGFTGKDITFWFDEYIQFKDINKELLISPPLKEKPIVRIKDKSVKIDLMNELLPGTTYSINFGNAISDLNEGNLLPDFEFVFSTGDQIDSLAVTGIALNAFDHKPLKDASILVMLYEDLSDSALLVKTPRYIGRASTNGLFFINNIHPDTCRIFAVNDLNGNLKYDPGSESVAFLDTVLVLNPATVKPVTFIKDTIKLQKPKNRQEEGKKPAAAPAVIDTTIVQGKKLNALDVSLYYFIAETDEVYLTGRKRDLPGKIFLSFSRSPHDSIRIRPLNYKPDHDWFVKEASTNKDSLTYWITDSLMAKKDTLIMAVSFTTSDSTGNLILRTDTVTLKYQFPEKSGSERKSRTSGKVKTTVKKMTVSSSIANRGMQNLNKSVVFTADKPLARIIPDSIELVNIKDSISTKQSFTCSADTNNVRRFRLSTKWKENSSYRLLMKPSAIRDIYGQTNDSLEIRFNTQKEEYYGRIIITVSGKHFPVIMEVMDQKDRIVDIKILKQPDKITVDFLSPDKYTLKAILDRNQNGHWDTGNYLKHIQPEPVFFYKMPVELRSNWDYEVIWEIPD